MPFLFFKIFFAACRILVPQLGIKPVIPLVEEQSPKHWTAQKVSVYAFPQAMSSFWKTLPFRQDAAFP